MSLQPSASSWTYRAAGSKDAVEFGTVLGRDVALPAHFHDEDQFTFVLSGRRRFLVGGETKTIEAGRSILIPARTVHRSVSEPLGVACLNLYVHAADYYLAAMMRDAEDLWRKTKRLAHGDLLVIADAHRLAWKTLPPVRVALCRSVADRAARAGLTREGFSRAFGRRHGMPPHAFALIARLNHARRLLRQGAAVAAAACDAGFADQSHLGRCFRRAFGVTPGRYRDGQIRSQTYQTGR